MQPIVNEAIQKQLEERLAKHNRLMRQLMRGRHAALGEMVAIGDRLARECAALRQLCAEGLTVMLDDYAMAPESAKGDPLLSRLEAAAAGKESI